MQDLSFLADDIIHFGSERCGKQEGLHRNVRGAAVGISRTADMGSFWTIYSSPWRRNQRARESLEVGEVLCRGYLCDIITTVQVLGRRWGWIRLHLLQLDCKSFNPLPIATRERGELVLYGTRYSTVRYSYTSEMP